MAIKTINKVLAQDEGFSSAIDCPVCDKNVSMRLFSTLDLSVVAQIAKDDKNLCFAICPCCSTVFTLNRNYLKEKNAGTHVTITKEDLKVAVKTK